MGSIIEWIGMQGTATTTGGASISHGLAFLTILLAFWKFPRSTSAFDPNPSQQNLPRSTPGGMPEPNGPVGNNRDRETQQSVHHSPVNPQFFPQQTHVKGKVLVSGDATNFHSHVARTETGTATSSETDTASSASGPVMEQEHHSSLSVTEEPSYYMKEQAPESTMAERYRFLKARDGHEPKALVNLHKYLEWKRMHDTIMQEQEIKYQHLRDDDNPQSEKQDVYDWMVASQTALKMHPPKHPPKNPGHTLYLPRIAMMMTLPHTGYHACDRDGRRIIHLVPAQMDTKVCSLSAYSLAIALYLDRKSNRNLIEKITLSLDVRPGRGWANIPGVKIIPFIKEIVTLLLTIFPERLHKSVTYPLPYALSWVFAVIKKVIDPETAKKLCVVTGPAGMDSPLPLDQLAPHVDRNVLLMFEKARIDAFLA